MSAHCFGRFVGIGLRVAGRVAGKRMAATRTSALQAVVQPQRTSDASARGREAAATARNVGRAAQKGAGGFFRSIRRASGIVALQVVGCFFFLPVLAFSPRLWQTRASWQAGPDHKTFVATAIVTVVFSYLGVTSFLRAGRK